MQKSIKKVIAGAIAALMITSSMPFVALAAPGDYEPDVQLQFSTFCNDPADPTDTSDSQSATAYTASGLAGYPLKWDQENGTLTASKDDINSYNTFFDPDAELTEDDFVLEEGNLFAVTIRLDKVDIAASGNVNIRFSDNLTPAGFYKYKKGTKFWYGFASEDSAPTSANNYAEVAGFRAPIGDWSASELYKGMNDTQVGDLSCIQEDPTAVEDDGWSDLMMTATLVCEGDYVDVSSVSSECGFFDIVEGKLHGDPDVEVEGYTYDNQFIVATFAFELTDATKPIQFALQDPNGDDLNGAAFFAKKHDDPSSPDKLTLDLDYATTYAPNGDKPGSTKMTFMGKNEHRSDVHVHNYVPTVTDPTCTEQGYTTYTCQNDGCDNPTYVDNYVPATGHSFTNYVSDGNATCTVDGTKTAKCDNCDATDTIADPGSATGHSLTNYVSDGNATCKDDGTKTAKCDNCDATDTITDVGSKDNVAHTWDNGVVTTEPTETSKGVKTYTCTVCGATRTEDIPMLEHTHNYIPVVTLPTCTEQGYTTYTCACGDSYIDNYVDANGHSFTNYVSDGNATCTVDGTKTAKCDNCDATDTIADPGSATGHSFTNYVSDGNATCIADGTKTAKCDNCDATDTITDVGSKDTADHAPAAAVDENVKPATKKEAGSKDVVVYCSVCKEELSRETVATDPALGVNITVAKTDIGIISGDIEADQTKNFAYGTEYTVTATPVEGATFVGWEINGNIVSKDATYTGTAVSDITITPVFEDKAAATITVTFYDKYGNTVKQYKDMDVADYQAAIAAEFDSIVAPTYPSYTFEAWDKTKDDILALDASTTIWATYKEVEEESVPKYTVTTNADVVLPDGIVNGEIPYDTKVTVKDDNAKAWQVGETIVAYGTEYSFYIGSDITIDPVYAAVEEKASTTIVGANLVAGSDYKFNIVATRNVPEGYVLSDYGFVYGKDLTDDELDLDKVGTVAASGATIKSVHAGTRNLDSNEFAFNYGIKAKNAPVTAKSFIVVTKGGETEIIYSDMFSQNY